jgi:hypothetical protein
MESFREGRPLVAEGEKFGENKKTRTRSEDEYLFPEVQLFSYAPLPNVVI